jgi:hypothetical protein
MMDERRRFQIALGGVASCLLIAAMFVSSAPPLEYPPVRDPQPAFHVASTGLDRPAFLPECCGIEAPAEIPRPKRRPAARPALYGSPVSARVALNPLPPRAAEVRATGSAPLLPRTSRIVLTSAPAARAASFTVSKGDHEAAVDDHGERGAVPAAFVTVGKEVGRGFRTAGRAIRAIF